jgi:hypothetical protein
MKNTHWLGRALLFGFAWIFVSAVVYVFLDAFGVWPAIPRRLAHAFEVLTGAVLVFELFGHLALSAGGASSLPS